MIDLDLEAPGLQYKLHPGKVPVDLESKSLARLLAQASNPKSRAPLNYDIALDVTSCIEPDATPESIIDQEAGKLLLIPAGDPSAPEYWRDLAAIDWPYLFGGDSPRGVLLMNEVREYLIDRYQPDVVLVDSRTGMTPSGGVATTLLPDVVVALMLNTPEHLDGSRVVISAVVENGAASGDVGPTVVPVLSRYTTAAVVEGAVPGRRLTPAMARRSLIAGTAEEEARALENVYSELTSGLSADLAYRVQSPFVLHADLGLQHLEALSFGPSARPEGGERSRGALLDDYLRLFSHVVPRDLLSEHVGGVRNRVRSIVLDRPDDAVRTLENLSALVGDEGVFRDLIKIHALRRDMAGAVSAAERLYDIRGEIAVDPLITRAISESGMVRRGSPLSGRLSWEFTYAYWQKAAPEDLDMGVGIVVEAASQGAASRAEQMAKDLFESSGSVALLAKVIRRLAFGNDQCERLAIRLADHYLDVGLLDVDFLEAAATASRYRRDKALASRIADAPAFGDIEGALAVNVLFLAGNIEEAAAQFVEVASTAADDDSVLEELSGVWAQLSRQSSTLRRSLTARDPQMVEVLDGYRAD